MLVKKLIEELKKLDGNLKVYTSSYNDMYYIESVKCIELSYVKKSAIRKKDIIKEIMSEDDIERYNENKEDYELVVLIL